MCFFNFLSCAYILNLKPCFSNSTWTIFDGTRLDRCALKSECERFQYGTNLMTRKFQKAKLNIFWPTNHWFQGYGFLTGLIWIDIDMGIWIFGYMDGGLVACARHVGVIWDLGGIWVSSGRLPGSICEAGVAMGAQGPLGTEMSRNHCVLLPKRSRPTISSRRDESDPHQTL